MAAVQPTRPPSPSKEHDESENAISSALDQLPSEAKELGIRAMQSRKLGDFQAAISSLDLAIEIEGDSWILWKHLALTHFDLWKHVASSRATNASTWFLEKHSQGNPNPLELFLRNAYDIFIVAMEYRENKHNPLMLLKLGLLYVEFQSFQGALALCTLILESTKVTTFSAFNEAVFLSALVARGLQHTTQSGEYFAYLVDIPPHKMHSYRLLVLAGMQFNSQPDSPEAVERGRVLYTEAYKRLISVPMQSPNASEKKALELYHTSRKSESERIQIWIGDSALWESLGLELFGNNYPFLAILAFEAAIARGGCRQLDCLIELGRSYHRVQRMDRAQTTLEQALTLNYYSHPTRFWLGAVSFPWCQHFKKEVRGAITFQRLYRGHKGRVIATNLRHKRAWKNLMLLICSSHLWNRAKIAKTIVAIRKAEELVREELARLAMHEEDWFLVFLKWNAAARKIQSLVPIYKAKKEKQRRRAWMERHKALLRRVVSNNMARLAQTCFCSMVEFVVIVQSERLEAAIFLQRNIRTWLCRQHLQRLKAKHKTQQALVDSFLGKTSKRWKKDCFVAWRYCLHQTKALRFSSALKIQCCYRSYKARQVFHARMAHQIRVRSFMMRIFASRDLLCLRQTFNALLTSALASRLNKHASATKIQKIVRGRQGRVLTRRVRKRHHHCELLVANALTQRTQRLMDQIWTNWQMYIQLSQLERLNAATTLQRLERGRQARHHAKCMREYMHVYYGRHIRVGYNPMRLIFMGLWKSRQYRCEREDKAARVIQRAVRRAKRRILAKNMREKLKRKMQVAEVFQKTFHAAANAFFNVLKEMRNATQAKFHNAARIIQRNLRGWLARKIFKRKAAQYREASSRLQRVKDRETRYWKSVVLRLWKDGVKTCQEQKIVACTRIQRRFRARKATKQARKVMEKRAKQRQLLDNAMSKPLARYFQQWRNKIHEKIIMTFEASKLAKHNLKSFKENMERISTTVPSMLFYHILTRTRQAGLCHLPPSHSFDRYQLRQLFQLATSVISDAASQVSNSSGVIETIANMVECPVQKLILYNEKRVDLILLTKSLENPSHRLTSIVLGGTQLTTRDITVLAVTLAQPNTKLQQLVLESCCLGDGGAIALALGLAQNTSIWKLDLSRNHIGDAACKYICEMLLQNESLQILGLNNNQFSDNGLLGYFEPALTCLPSASSLESLQLQGNPRITNRSIVALQNAIAHRNSIMAKKIRLEVT